MFLGKNAPPSYRKHKPSGQAVVTLNGHDCYLGPYGTRFSRDAYDRIVSEWLAAGRTTARIGRDDAVGVASLVNAFRKSSEATPSHEHDYQAVYLLLIRLYGRTDVSEFGPLALKALREQMLVAGWNRATINRRVYMVRRIFRWGVANEMVPPDISHALDAVEGLRAGRTLAPEPTPVEPVSVEHVEACLPFMPEMARAMVRLQLATGMRAGELVIMRTRDIDASGPIWVYRPATHKTAYKGHVREITIGPNGQAVLEPYLLPDLEAHIFSPEASELRRRAVRTASRITPLSCGNRTGSNRVSDRTRPPRKCYDVCSYRRAIYRAADAAYPPPAELARRRGEKEKTWRQRLGARWQEVMDWRDQHRWHPHQLRHTFADRVRRQFGLEHTQKALGHSAVASSTSYNDALRGNVFLCWKLRTLIHRNEFRATSRWCPLCGVRSVENPLRGLSRTAWTRQEMGGGDVPTVHIRRSTHTKPSSVTSNERRIRFPAKKSDEFDYFAHVDTRWPRFGRSQVTRNAP